MGLFSYKKFIFSLSLLAGVSLSSQVFAGESAFSQQEVADYTKPSVVKIVQHVKGDAAIPAISIDFKSGTVSTKKEATPDTVQVNEYLSGSGIIVTPDGYIMTNSHVISYQTIKNAIVSDYIYQAIDEGYASLTPEEVKNISESQTPTQMAQFAEKIADFTLSESNFNLEKNIVVLNPSSKKDSLEELVVEGFPASVVSVNDNFFKDRRDAGLIKVGQQNLPAINLGTSAEVSTGKKVYIFGFPSTAEINDNDLLEATFSQGTISAIKSSPSKNFKIFQTDAKISKGSSGGPLIDEQGKVIGLVTFMTSDLTKQDGDSFAFSIPIDEAKDIIAENSTGGQIPSQFQTGNYANRFANGLEYLKKSQCRNALSEFALAKQINPDFDVLRYIGPYEKQCDEIISAGKSIDGFWQSLEYKLSDAKNLIIFLSVIGGLLIAGLAFSWYWLFRRMRHDEKELDNVEEFLHLDTENGEPKEDSIVNANDLESRHDHGLPDHLRPKLDK